MSIILSLAPRTTKITILSCMEAAAQRNNAVIRPPPLRTMYENFNRKETLTSISRQLLLIQEKLNHRNVPV